jgi:protein-S-isoprenylcysteine O-methyltransferase Ste14
MSLGVLLLILGVIALAVYYWAAPHPVLRIAGVLLVVAGLLLLLLPPLLDASDNSRHAAVLLLGLRP